jgi:hypothetical protein
MAFTKIQPQQLQLPTFTSPSGDFSFTDLSTGIQINLDRTITGPMVITELKTSAETTILTVADNNSFSENSICIAGVNNRVSGDNNVLLNGRSTTEFSGSFNTLVNGKSVNFGASGQQNTILGGDGVSFADQVTGSVILADHETAVTNSTNHSLMVSFESGVTFQNGDVQFNGDNANFSSHLKVDSSHSGIFSGNCSIGGALDVHDLIVTGATQFSGSVDMDDPVRFHDSVLLQDSSEAASQTWVNETGVKLLMGAPGNSALAPYLNTAVGTSFGTNAFSKMGTNDTLSGHLLVDTIGDPDKARLVFTCHGFTGVIAFDAFQTGAIPEHFP